MMKRASVSVLRHEFEKIERMLKAGKQIEITKHNKVIARLVPVWEAARERQVVEKPVKMPDFLGRMKKIFGDRILEPSSADLISKDRDRF